MHQHTFDTLFGLALYAWMYLGTWYAVGYADRSHQNEHPQP